MNSRSRTRKAANRIISIMCQNPITFPIAYSLMALIKRQPIKLAVAIPSDRDLLFVAMLKGPKLLVPKKTLSFVVEIFANNIYGRVFDVETGDVVIDVGAHVGLFTVKAAKEAGPEGLLIAIEPDLEDVVLLRKNIAINRLSNIRVIAKALSDRKGRAKLFLHKSGHHSLVIREKNRLKLMLFPWTPCCWILD